MGVGSNSGETVSDGEIDSKLGDTPADNDLVAEGLELPVPERETDAIAEVLHEGLNEVC